MNKKLGFWPGGCFQQHPTVVSFLTFLYHDFEEVEENRRSSVKNVLGLEGLREEWVLQTFIQETHRGAFLSVPAAQISLSAVSINSAPALASEDPGARAATRGRCLLF